MDNGELNKLMIQLSEDAVVFAKSEFGIELNHSLEDIGAVDLIIQRLKELDSVSLKNKELFTLSNVFGAYIGESIKNRIGGQWLYDLSDEFAPASRLIVENSDYPFASFFYQHLIGSPKVSVYEYALNALERHL